MNCLRIVKEKYKSANRVAWGLSPPAPTEHPACGSARGASQSLPGRSRVMNVWIGRVHDVPHARSTARLHCVIRTHGISFPFSVFGPSPLSPGITPGVGLLWRLLTSAPSLWQVALQGAMRKNAACVLSMIRSHPMIAFRMCLDLYFPVVRSGIFRRADLTARGTDLPG